MVLCSICSRWCGVEGLRVVNVCTCSSVYLSPKPARPALLMVEIPICRHCLLMLAHMY